MIAEDPGRARLHFGAGPDVIETQGMLKDEPTGAAKTGVHPA